MRGCTKQPHVMDETRRYRAICDKSCHEYKNQRVKKKMIGKPLLRIDVASAKQRYNNI